MNKKYENSIRNFRKCGYPQEILNLWRESYDVGNIPGPYWAALRHPEIDYEVTIKLYSDVHMLSHLVGSSNRADIARLSELEFELADAMEKNKSLIVRNREKVNKLRNEIERNYRTITRLERENSNLKVRLFVDSPTQSVEEINEEFSQGVLLSGENYTALLSEHAYSESKVVRHNLRLVDDVEKLNADKRALKSELEVKGDELETLLAELHSANSFIQTFITKNDAHVPKCNLFGKCILNIGGRESNMCRMYGRLIHHDGGREDSLAKLQGAISSADAVIFPVDCVSHSSALEAKKLCKKMLKPFMPIRSSSLSSLVTGLAEFKFDDDNLNVKEEESNKP